MSKHKCTCQDKCPCHKPDETKNVKAPAEVPAKVKKTRRRTDKPPTPAQLAQRKKFEEKIAEKKALRAKHPDWSKKQLNEAIGWKSK
jgi:hypothetical protein